HPYYQRGHHLHACALAVAARPARECAVQRHTGVAACRLSHACDLPTGWTSAAYDISLSTITKSGHEPMGSFATNVGGRGPLFAQNVSSNLRLFASQRTTVCRPLQVSTTSAGKSW